MQDYVETLAQTLKSDDEGPPSLPAQGQNISPTPPKSIAKLLNHAELRKMTQQMGQIEVERINANRVCEVIPKFAEEAH